MTKSNKCPECGGERVEVDIGVGIQLGPCLQCGYGDLREVDKLLKLVPDKVKPCLRWPCSALRSIVKDDYILKAKCTEADWRKCPFTEGGNKVLQEA